MMKLLKINSILSWDSNYNRATLNNMSDEDINTIHKSFFKV